MTNDFSTTEDEDKVNFDKLDDHKLMKLAGAGRKRAFSALVHRYQQPLLNFFVRLGAYIDKAEDLVQETFIRVYNYRDRYEPDARFTTFLYTLARHVWIDELRRVNRKRRFEVQVDGDPLGECGGHIKQTDLEMDVQLALERLSEKLRIVVVLNIYQGLKYKEIAEVLDIPIGTVKSRMSIALNNIEEELSVVRKERE